MISALEVYRSLPRYVAARAVGPRLPGLLAGPLAPLRLVHQRRAAVSAARAGFGCGPDSPASAAATLPPCPVTPRCTSRRWSRCRSSPATRSSARLRDDAPGMPGGHPGRLDPVLGCVARGLDALRRLRGGRSATAATGSPSATCRPACRPATAATPAAGGAASSSRTSPSCTRCPTSCRDDRAVLIEPLACAVHIARRAAAGRRRLGPDRRRRRGRTVRRAGAARADTRRPGHRRRQAPQAAELAGRLGATDRRHPRRGRRRRPPVDPGVAARAGTRRAVPAGRRRRRDRRGRLAELGRHRAAPHPGRRPRRARPACRATAST